MKTIYKYPLPAPETRGFVSLHDGAVPVLVGTQREPVNFISVPGQEPEPSDLIGFHDVGYLWAIVDTQAEVKVADIEVIGTGEAIPFGARHIGSYMAGRYVWHVIEHKDSEALSA